MIESIMRAFTTRDPDDYMRHLAEDDDLIVIGTGPNEVVRGYTAVREILTEQLAELESATTTQFLWHAVSRNGDTAWASGEIAFTVRLLDGAVWQAATRYTAVFVRSGGRWLGKTIHVSIPDAAPPEGSWWPHPIDRLAEAVGYERPDLRAQMAPDGLVTMLFTDIESSTELNERLGDIRWMQALREHNALVRTSIAVHGGVEVKTIGDAFMVAFSSARRAVLCAKELQGALAAYNRENPETEMRIRIGVHAGEPVREGNDFFGRSVTEASRIVGAAQGGEILVSALVHELVDAAGDIMFDAGRDVELKGIAGSRRVYAVSR